MSRELALQTHELTKQFDRHLAVNHVDLDIPAGEVYGLIGPNGAGKTTLMRLLVRDEEPTFGEIYIHGQHLHWDKPDPNLQRRIGFLPDDFPLYDDLSVSDYLDYFARLYELPPSRRRQRVYEVLELVQLTGKARSPIKTLSRGMKQRLGLARTIIHEPILLLLDEPVSGLDPVARQQFRDIIRTLQSAGMTILISSHILSDLAELCTSVGIMELGCLVESTRLVDLYQRFQRQRLQVSVLSPAKELVQLLEQWPGVEEVHSVGTHQIEARFEGDRPSAAQLLRHLIEQGIAVDSFQLVTDNLEAIFLNYLDHKQAG